MIYRLCLFVMSLPLVLPCLAGTILDKSQYSHHQQQNIALVQRMFTEFAEKRDITKLDMFYDKHFILESNHVRYDYDVYKKQQQAIFLTLKSLHVLHYDDIFAVKDKVVSRMSIQLIQKDGQALVFYVIAIFHITSQGKIDNVWEITYPSWADKLPKGQEA